MHPVEQELPYYIRSNCWEYTKTRYPSLPPTAVIWANIQQEPAEVIVMMYHIQHFAVVESYTDTTITISETNFGGAKKTVRTIPRSDSAIVGFYSL